MAANVGRRSLGALFKQACDEIPEVVGSSFAAVVGLGFTGIALYIYETKNLEKRKYKLMPTVIRPDDPRAKLIRD